MMSSSLANIRGNRIFCGLFTDIFIPELDCKLGKINEEVEVRFVYPNRFATCLGNFSNYS